MALFADCVQDVSATYQDCKTPALFFAVAKGNAEDVKALLGQGGDVNVTDKDGQTALFYATANGHVEVVEALLSQGGDANATDQDGCTSLFVAAEKGNVEVVEALLGHGANVNAIDHVGRTALLPAAEGNVEVVETFLAYGGHVNASDQTDRTALIYAAYKGNVKVVEVLLRHGGDVDASDQASRTALIYAADQGNVEVVEALLAHGADVSASDQDGMTALFPAAGKGNEEIAEALLKKGAKVNATDKNGLTALFYAADQSSVEVVKTLLDHGANVNATDQTGRTALFRAADQGNVEVVEVLLDHGAGDVDATDKQGMTALFVAVYETNVEVVEALLIHGANVNAIDRCGQTALFYAGSLDVVEALLLHGAIVDIRDQSGQTALFTAVMSGKSDVVDILLKCDANAIAVDKSGKSAVFYTVNLIGKGVPIDGIVEIIKLFMNKGEGPNTKQSAGENLLLHFLSFARDIKGKMDESSLQSLFSACQFLVDCKSDLDSVNYNGQSVIHLVLLLLGDILQQEFKSNDLMIKHHVADKSLKLICSVLSCSSERLANLRDGTDGNTPLHLWASIEKLQQLKNQSSSEVVFNTDNAAGYTESPLNTIAMHLLSHGAKINIPNNNGETPLHMAQTWNAAKLLLDNGALPDARDLQGNTPLLSRVKKIVDKHLTSAPHLPLCEIYNKTNTETLEEQWKEIFRYRLNPRRTNNAGRTLLGSLLESDAHQLIQALLKVTKLPNSPYLKDDNGDTPLHTICRNIGEAHFWKLNLIEDLVSSETSIVNRTERKGQTALHIVCQSESCSRLTCEVVQKLRTYSASLDILDNDGKTCMDIAEEKPGLRALLTQDLNISDIKPWLPWSQPNRSERHKNLLAEVARGQNSRQAGILYYHVKTPIGKGAFGFVYAGLNSKDGREVAVKQIVKVQLSRPEDRREIKNLVGLRDCEHVVRYLNYHVDPDFLYIVLELMDGNLTELLDGDLQFKNEEVSLCRDVLNGMMFVHQQGLKHRDIKPGNILYKRIPKLSLKLADFGLSSQITNNDTTVMHSKAGTKCWMAPELLKETAKHSEASDMFACGLVVHYMLSVKKHPFGPEIVAEKGDLVIKHETEDNLLNYRLTVDDGLGHEARDLVEQLLDSNETKRPLASAALKHPFFWSYQKMVDFLMQVGNQKEIGRSRLSAHSTLSSVEQDLEKDLRPQPSTKCWNTEIPQVYAEMTSRRPYDTTSAVDLLRMFRNAHSHLPELTPMTKESILEKKIFFDKYPNLVMVVYKAVISSGWDKRKEIAAVLKVA